MLQQIFAWLTGRLDDQEGATAVEYGVMVALIAVVVIAGALALGRATNDELTCTATSIAESGDQCNPASQ